MTNYILLSISVKQDNLAGQFIRNNCAFYNEPTFFVTSDGNDGNRTKTNKSQRIFCLVIVNKIIK